VPGTVVLLVAHGSRLHAASEAHEEVCRRLGRAVDGRVRVSPAYLELADPDIPAAIDAAVATGASRVLVVPYFLHPGNHTARDIPAAVAAARARNPGATLELTDLFGGDPALVDVLATQVTDLLQDGSTHREEGRGSEGGAGNTVPEQPTATGTG